ncbi:ABC transporter permease [Patescibacteria group bacterium]|nr:ABC transporter permease [Patescibacteria group bacterium]
MNFKGIINLSLIGLKTNKTRSALTMLGIIIGIGAVIVIMSVGAGAQSLILDQVQKVGTNLIGIMPGAPSEEGPPATAFGITVTTLKYEDGLAVAREVPEISAAASFVRGIETVSWQNQKKDTTFVGTTASYIEVEDTEVELGHFFSEQEEKSVIRVAALGYQLAQELFGQADPIGQKVKIRRESFEVIGVMKERGSVGFESVDDQIFIPLKTAQKLLLGINHVSVIRAKVKDNENIDAIIPAVKQIIRDRHGIRNSSEDDFDVRNQAEALAMLTTITNALNYFLAAMAAISLIVGGIGIMNIMYVTVSERYQEIGLRKAVGAKKNNLLSQFLIEAIIVTLLGGIIGIIGGALVSGSVALGANYLGYNWAFIITPFSIIIAVSVAAAIGLIFGYFPARKAAKLDPITALRYE